MAKSPSAKVVSIADNTCFRYLHHITELNKGVTMKTIGSFLVLILIGITLHATTYPIFSENFNTLAYEAIPTGWTRTHNLWGANTSNNAGGQSREMRFRWDNQTGTSSLTTSNITVGFYPYRKVSFKTYVSHYAGSGTYTLSLQCSPDNGGAWTTIWQTQPSANFGATTVTADIPSSYNQAKFRFQIVGYWPDINSWHIDDFEVYGSDLLAPSNLSATAVSSSQINLSWTNNNTFATYYRIRRMTAATGQWEEIATTSGTSYSNTGLSPNTTYYYGVQAYNLYGFTSEYSYTAQASTPNTIPNAPSNLSVTPISSSQINLNWNDNSNTEDGFKIERRTTTGSWSQLTTVPANTTTYQNTGLSPDTIYRYRVRAYNSAGNSDYSNEAYTQTPQAIPNPPSNLLATAVSTSQINLSWWDNSNNESGFKIERRIGTTGSWNFREQVSANTTSFQDTGLSSGVPYYYRVYAYNWGGDSDYSNINGATTFINVPNAPSNLSASAVSSSQINLSWNDNSNNEDGFRIERKIGSGGTWSQVATVGSNVTTYQNAGLSSGTTYYYRVRAYNSAGNSNYSNEANATTQTIVTIPNAPSNLSASAVSSSQINLSWNDNSNNEDGFRIERKLGVSGSWSQIAQIGANNTSYQSTGLSSGTTYYYRVRAYNDAGNSSYSNEANATTQTIVTIPNAPSNLSASAVSSSQINLSWNDNSNNEDGFRIERKLGVSGSWSQIAQIGANSASYQSTGLSSSTTYYYRVRAYNSVGNSSYSNEANATTTTTGNVVLMSNGSTTVSSGSAYHFYDSGGPDSNYNNNENFTYTFNATTGYRVNCEFFAFNTESGWDYLYIYDGPNTESPLLGQFHGSNNPGSFASSHSSGALTFRFTSDGSVVSSGWYALLGVDPVQGQNGLNISKINQSTIRLSWIDETGNGLYRIYDSNLPLDTDNDGWSFLAEVTGSYYDVAVSHPSRFYHIRQVLQTVATPTFNPAGGTYSSAQSVTISCSTPSATIRYTTNGSDPNEGSAIYNGSIMVSSTTTIKARAYRSGWTPSSIASATYTISTSSGDFVLVPGGTFTMGDTHGVGWSEELPTHTVTLNSFFIGTYEVTQAEYSQYMQPSSSWTSNYGLGDNYPAYYVSWYAILKYCNLRSIAEGLTPVYSISGSTNPANWGSVPTSNNSTWNAAICNWNATGYRLPTEAEWEYAARGRTNNPDYLYSGSDDVNAVAWYSGNNSPYGSKPVGTKAPNGISTYDMSGNIWEWCWDWYSSYYYSSSPSSNPTGPATGSYRLLRGGYWGDNAPCRVSYRSSYNPYNSGVFSGFRLCRAIN